MTKTNLLSHWRRDLPASVVVFLVAVPLCLGIALASGAPLISGLIAGVIGGLVVGFASGSALGVTGPAAGLAAIVLTSITQLESFELFLVTVVLAGLIQIGLGLARAGVIAYYFPSSVIKGMLVGIGIIIFLKQLPHAFGYDKDFEGDVAFWQSSTENTFSSLINMFGAISPGATLVALAGVILMLLWERPFVKRQRLLALFPGPLMTVMAGIALAALFQGNVTLAIQAEHLVQLPAVSDGVFSLLTFPDWSGLLDPQVWVIALTIAVVASLETLLCVEATDKLDPRKRITPTDRELVAQGIGNTLSGLIGGLPVTQVIVRSSANIQSGGQSKLSTITHGALILLSVLLFPQIMNRIPLASLAAILLITGYKLANPRLFRLMYLQGWTVFSPFLTTVIGVVLIDLLKGVILGMIVGIFILLRNNFRVPFHFDAKAHVPGTPIRIHLSEDVTFLNKASIMRTLAELPEGAHVILDASRTVDLDPDVREIIRDEVVRAADQGITLECVGFEPREMIALTELHEAVLLASDRSANPPARA